jgi:hypothetical protein
VQHVRGAAVCTACDQLCLPIEKHEQEQRRQSDRARSLFQELGVIVSYPLRDRLGFVLLVIFVYLASFMPFYAWLFSTGVLLWYVFYALSRVADGNLRDFAPDFRDVGDLVAPVRLSFAAMLISVGPLLVALYFTPRTPLHDLGARASIESARPARAEPEAAPNAGASAPYVAAAQMAALPDMSAPAQEQPSQDDAPEATEPEAGAATPADSEAPPPEEPDEPRPSALAYLALALTALWALAYTPVALAVAALSRSFLSTINPLVGLDTIRRMGATYWQAWALYFGLVVAQGVVGAVLSFIPFLGGLLRAFVDAYAGLAVACTLGLAVYKKAPELDWD